MATATERLAFGVEPDGKAYRLRLARYAALAEAIIAYVRAERPHGVVRILDAGAGRGRTYRYLEPHDDTERMEFHAVDRNPRRIDGLYKPDRWRRVTRGDLCDGLDYEDDTFDVVICEQVLEHLDEPQRVLRELLRVLRPGGMLIAGVPTFPPILAQARRHIVPLFDALRRQKHGHVQAFTAGSFRRLVERSGGVRVTETRGFRIVSGGILAALENYRWWYRLNRGIGRVAPWLCIETQVLARKLYCLFSAAVIAI